MGMFDYVHLNAKTPWPVALTPRWYQTKDFCEPLMRTFEITDTGGIVLKGKSGDEPCHFTGVLEIYSSLWHDKINEDGEELPKGFGIPHGWVSMMFEVKDGQVTKYLSLYITSEDK